MAIQGFAAVPHPANAFLNPIVNGGDLEYTATIQNFQQSDRVVVMLMNVTSDLEMSYLYDAHLIIR